MTLAIGTPVRWPNPPLGWRTGTIIAVVPRLERPDFVPFSDARRYRARSVTSYLVREAGPGGRILWPDQDRLEATGPAPAVRPLTDEELAWCQAHPGHVRAAMRAASTL